MSLYYRNLKRIGLSMILVALINLVYETLLRRYIVGTGTLFETYVPLQWGIVAKNLIGVAAGGIALLFYAIRRRYTLGTVVLILLCGAEAAVIVMSTKGSALRRTNGIVDITMLMMVLLTYTLSQTDRDIKRWNSVRTRKPVALDLKLADRKDFFDPVQIGPKMAINRVYANAITRFITAMKEPSPLTIDLFCANPVPEPVRNMMREAMTMHDEEAEDAIIKKLEMRYRRIMRLITVSVLVIGLVRQTSLLSDGTVVWEIIGNFAAFGLWQIGYTHYERNEGYEDLLTVHIAKYSELRFIER